MNTLRPLTEQIIKLKNMKRINLKEFEELLDIKLDEKFDTRLVPIQKTLNEHKVILDELLLEKRNRDDDKNVKYYRVGRLETWAQKVGKKVDIKFET